MAGHKSRNCKIVNTNITPTADKAEEWTCNSP